ncbi:MAG TPA: peptide MFS transporter [Steroidobacteraceae bacterium]|nr:peptide MFS transporter [Steroidobacteraceae bacterium]
MTSEKTWFGHPRGLTVLALTNTWEQFSYYGMRALLVYYMTKQLLMGQATSSVVYGIYTACAYFTPLIGGLIADRVLGKKRAIIIGGSVMALGHFMMTLEPLFYVALATIAIGNGLFLPSLPSQIGDLYERGDPRAGRAYNVYYVGVNIGGFLAPLICGTLGEVLGWHWGFGAAGVGMVIGLVIYLSGQRYLPAQTRLPRIEQHSAPRENMARDTVLLLFGLGVAVTVFRSAYEQIGNTVALWADTGVDKVAGQFVIPMTWFISINPLCVMLMTPVLLAWWRKREAAGFTQLPTQRMATGALIVSASYLLLAALSLHADNVDVRWPWFALFFFVLTVGELFILPTGLGLFARLAPRRLGATTVASWFLASFAGSLAAGLVGSLWTQMSHPGFFALLAAICAFAAIGLRLMDSRARLVAEVSRPRADPG